MKLTRRLRFIFLLSLISVFPTTLWAQVAISPQIFTINLNGSSKTYAFRFMNFTKSPKRIQVVVNNWSMNGQGKIEIVPPTRQSLSPWIQINPREFTVAPGSSQVVRFAIRPALRLMPGEHRAMVFFDELPMPGEKHKKGTIRAFFRLGAAIYAQVGPKILRGRVLRSQASPRGVNFEVRNTGNATVRFEGFYTVWRQAAKPGPEKAFPAHLGRDLASDSLKMPKGMLAAARLPNDAVLPGASREVQLIFPPKYILPPGHYIIWMKGHLGRTLINASLPLQIKPKGK